MSESTSWISLWLWNYAVGDAHMKEIHNWNVVGKFEHEAMDTCNFSSQHNRNNWQQITKDR